jgi:hypothetical protein
MAPQQQDKLRKYISELIARPKNVDYEEVAWVMDQLRATCRRTKHCVMFRVPGCDKPLMLNKHNDGKSHLPSYCIADFRNRMVELGLYGTEEEYEDD